MGCWPGRYVIGLTGNIGAGKTTVRRILQGLGAFGIDADNLVHTALQINGAAYNPVVQAFGHEILNRGGQVDRHKLAHLVFHEPDQLARLEAIIHPIVQQEIEHLVTQARQPVVVIEAIKLIEGGLAKKCDAVWVVQASQEQQLDRVTKHRGMSSAQVMQRMRSQTPQTSKASRADVIIQNDGSPEETRIQVNQVWRRIGLSDAN